MKSQSIVIINENRAITTSLQVAETFERDHKNVLRDIRELGCSDDFRRLNFELSSYLNEQAKEQPMFEITKNGFVILVMGYTGEKAMQFKEAYINAFDAMERQLLQGAKKVKPLSIGNAKFIKNLIAEIKSEINLETRQQRLALLHSYCEQHGVDINRQFPEQLPSTLTDDEQRELVDVFFSSLKPIREAIDHSTKYGQLAISFDHLYQYCTDNEIWLPEREKVQELLEINVQHPLLDIKKVWSRLYKKPLHCWIFDY